MLGQDVLDAINGPFFARFALAESSRESGGSLVFRPSGFKLRSFVAVRLTSDAHCRVQAVDLHLHRGLIEHPAQVDFAHEIAASLLLGACPPEDLPILQLLVAELERSVEAQPPEFGVLVRPRTWLTCVRGFALHLSRCALVWAGQAFSEDGARLGLHWRESNELEADSCLSYGKRPATGVPWWRRG